MFSSVTCKIQNAVGSGHKTTYPLFNILQCNASFGGILRMNFFNHSDARLLAPLSIPIARKNLVFYNWRGHTRNLMQTMARIFGFTLLLSSVFFFLAAVACSTLSDGPAGLSIILGIVMFTIGLMLSRAAIRKTCPQCSERIKYAATVCHYCGQTFI